MCTARHGGDAAFVAQSGRGAVGSAARDWPGRQTQCAGSLANSCAQKSRPRRPSIGLGALNAQRRRWGSACLASAAAGGTVAQPAVAITTYNPHALAPSSHPNGVADARQNALTRRGRCWRPGRQWWWWWCRWHRAGCVCSLFTGFHCFSPEPPAVSCLRRHAQLRIARCGAMQSSSTKAAALHAAAAEGLVHVAEQLLREGHDVNETDQASCFRLHGSDGSPAHSPLPHPPPPPQHGMTTVHHACSWGQLQFLKWCLAQGAAPNTKDQASVVPAAWPACADGAGGSLGAHPSCMPQGMGTQRW